MKYTLEERLEIGRRIYEDEISKTDAAKEYDIGVDTARDYMRLYRDTYHLNPKNLKQGFCKLKIINLCQKKSFCSNW